jgi:hypothetical protein
VLQFNGLSDADRQDDAFVVPFALSTSGSSRFAMGRNSLYETDTDGFFLSKVRLHNPGTKDKVRTMAYGTPTDPTVLYVGYGKKIGVRGTVHRDDNFDIILGDPLERSFDFKETITDIVINPDNWQVAYASSLKELYRTTDGGQTWKRISDAFEGAITLFRTVEIFNPTADPNDEVLLVGGYGGVFAAHSPRSDTPTWAKVGAGLPFVQVTDLHYDPGKDGKDLLYIGTWGRGVWSLNDPAKALGNVLVINGDEDPTRPNDTIVLERDATQKDLLKVKINDQPKGMFPIEIIRGIVVNGGDGSDRLIVDNTVDVIGRYPKELPSNAYIDFRDSNTVDLDELQVLGISSTTTGKFYTADSFNNDTGIVTVSRKGLSTTIQYENIEISPNNIAGQLAATTASAVRSLDKSLRDVKQKDPAKVKITSVLEKTDIPEKAPIPLNSSKKKKVKNALVESFRESVSIVSIVDRLF